MSKIFYVVSVEDVVGKDDTEKITLLHLDELRVKEKQILLQRCYDAIDFFFEHHHPFTTQLSPLQWIVDSNAYFSREINACHLDHICYESGEWVGKFVVPQNKYKVGNTFDSIPEDFVKE